MAARTLMLSSVGINHAMVFVAVACACRVGVVSVACERVVMRAVLKAEVIDRSWLFPIYSVTMLCCTSQTEVAEGLLLGRMA